MGWQIVSDEEKPNVLAAVKDGRCVSCYGAISRDCPTEQGFYCCVCDDTECTECTT